MSEENFGMVVADLKLKNDKLQSQLAKVEQALKFYEEVLLLAEKIAKSNPAGYYKTDEEIDSESPEDTTCANAGKIVRAVQAYFAQKEKAK